MFQPQGIVPFPPPRRSFRSGSPWWLSKLFYGICFIAIRHTCWHDVQLSMSHDWCNGGHGNSEATYFSWVEVILYNSTPLCFMYTLRVHWPTNGAFPWALHVRENCLLAARLLVSLCLYIITVWVMLSSVLMNHYFEGSVLWLLRKHRQPAIFSVQFSTSQFQQHVQITLVLFRWLAVSINWEMVLMSCELLNHADFYFCYVIKMLIILSSKCTNKKNEVLTSALECHPL